MKQNSISIGLVVMMVAVTLIGCSTDEMDNMDERQKEKIISLTSSVRATRSISDQQNTQLAAGAKVGAFGVPAEGTTITNAINNLYTADGSGNLTTGTEDMSCSGNATIFAYAPYQTGWSYGSANAFTIATDQSTDAAYLASDLLMANASVSRESSTANLIFTHMLSRVCITLKNSTIDDMSGVSISILNTKPTTTLNLSTGVLSEASGDATTITLASGQSIPVGRSVKAYGIIVPQDIVSGTALIDVTFGGKTIKWTTNNTVIFACAAAYNIALEIKDNTISGEIGTATGPAL